MLTSVVYTVAGSYSCESIRAAMPTVISLVDEQSRIRMGFYIGKVLVGAAVLGLLTVSSQCTELQPLYKCNGTNFEEDFGIAHITTGTERYVSVVALPSLGETAFAIAYEAESGSLDFDVWTRVYESKEILESANPPTMRVNTKLSLKQVNSKIAAIPSTNGTAKIVASWDSLGGQDGDQFGAYSRVVMYSGGSLQGVTSEFRLDNQTSGRQQGARIAVLSNETAAYTWFTEVKGQEVAIRVFNLTSGSAITDRRLVSSDAGTWAFQGNQQEGTVIQLTNGSLVVAFEDRQNDQALIRIFNYNLASSSLIDVVEMFAFASNSTDIEHPLNLTGIYAVNLAPLPNSSFVCVVASSEGLFVRKYNVDGSSLSVLERVDPRGPISGNPSVHPLPDGGFMVLWAEGEVTLQDIYVRRYYADGRSTDIMAVNNRESATGSNLGAPEMAVLGDGEHVFVAWQDATGLDGNGRGLFGNLFCLSPPVESNGRLLTCSFNQCNLTCSKHSCITGNDDLTPLALGALPPSVQFRWREEDSPGNTELVVDFLSEASIPHVVISDDAAAIALEYENGTTLGIVLRMDFSTVPTVGNFHSGWTLYFRQDGRLVLSFKPHQMRFDGYRLSSIEPLDSSTTFFEVLITVNDSSAYPTLLVNNEVVSMNVEYDYREDTMKLNNMLRKGVVYFGEARTTSCGLSEGASNSTQVFLDYAGIQLLPGEDVSIDDFFIPDDPTSCTLETT